MRHPEPEIVTTYREWAKTGPPRCCHTCDHYSKDGKCMEFDLVPPVEFASEPGGCALWIWEVPF